MLPSIKSISPLSNSKRRKFGQVFLVENQETNERYVLKQAKIHTISQRALQQLKNESCFSFSHPQLPTVCGVEQTQDTFSLLLSYKNGVPLSIFWKGIPKKQRLTFTILWIKKLVELLDILHAQGIYHCDIKPSNILIQAISNEQIDNFQLHLIDFGMAIEQHTHTSKNRLIFPLGFAPPEQILQRTHLIHPNSDYFAIGISVFYLWTATLPLSHPNPSIFTNLQLAHPIPYHRAMPKKLNEWIAKVCHKPYWRTAPNLMTQQQIDFLLQEAINKRYRDSTALLDDLCQITK